MVKYALFFFLSGLQDPHLPAHVVLHGVYQARRLRRLQQGGAREGQERGRLVRIPHGVNNNRVSSKNIIVFFTGNISISLRPSHIGWTVQALIFIIDASGIFPRTSDYLF